ncbi:glycosyltransferase [Curtobacterium sp. MCPF17_001]|uniref:glycosyltransferase n=1 Tax=Curtobacterium sp. MCPF17_001 TaxID=2175651 RepID=UPI0015E8DF78|nr:glycosyltransferase [Curtobacterium sp. MCPF17_001]
MKVLHVLGSLRPSGMERMLVSAAPYFAAAGVHTSVIGQGDDQPFADSLRNAGYTVDLVESIAGSWRNALHFRKIVRSSSIDVIHIHVEANYLRNVIVARWALGTRGSIVRTVHSIFPARGRWWFSRAVQAAIGDRFTRAIIAPSPDVELNERGIGRRTRTIMNWVDDRMFALAQVRSRTSTCDDGPPVALILGNCGSVKNHDIALQALASTDHKLLHLGDERDASAQERRSLDELEQRGQLLSRGPASPDDALVAADYFLLPSVREGMSVALAEALTVGLPAIINDAPGLRWAASAPGVRVVAAADEWETALQEFGSVEPQAGDAVFDFSASRGVDEYLSAYGISSRRAEPSEQKA